MGWLHQDNDEEIKDIVAKRIEYEKKQDDLNKLYAKQITKEVDIYGNKYEIKIEYHQTWDKPWRVRIYKVSDNKRWGKEYVDFNTYEKAKNYLNNLIKKYKDEFAMGEL